MSKTLVTAIFLIFLSLHTPSSCSVSLFDDEQPETFIVYVSHSDKPSVYTSHHEWYSSTLQSLPPSSHPREILYTYTHAANGFAVRLTPSEALHLSSLPGITSVLREQVHQRRGQKEEATYGVVKEPAPCGPGPWGGDGGRPWDDGVFSGIKQIFLTIGEAICSIQIEYDRNGQSVWSARHGGSGGDTTNRIKFDYPHEVVTCISGYYGSISEDERHKVIRSLTFFTSRGKYGPFGEEIGTFFTSTITEGKVVGLNGRSSLYLDAIGIHMQYWLGHDDRRPPKSSVLSKFFY